SDCLFALTNMMSRPCRCLWCSAFSKYYACIKNYMFFSRLGSIWPANGANLAVNLCRPAAVVDRREAGMVSRQAVASMFQESGALRQPLEILVDGRKIWTVHRGHQPAVDRQPDDNVGQ